MTIEIADLDGSVSMSDLATIWFESWADANRDLARGHSAAVLVPELEREIGAGRWQVRTARRDGTLVAFAAMAPAERRLVQLFVLPQAQRHGVGAALLQDAKARFPTGLVLRTQATNIDGLRFYARHGFTETHRVPHETQGYEMVWLRWVTA